MPRRTLYVTSATGALSTRSTPVGGGVAVLEALLPELKDLAPDQEIVCLRPGSESRCVERAGVAWRDLPVPALAGADPEVLLALSEVSYAKFARQWEAALGRFFADCDPATSVILANDVSEGPPFAELARRGFAQVVIYHVVVGEFFARQYLSRGGLSISAATAGRWWRWLERKKLARWTPSLLRLVWAKEAAAARWAHAIVPSQALADSLAAIYPETGVARHTTVIPWGVVGEPEPERRASRTQTWQTFGVDPERFVLLMLSRLSPEKRIELAFDALATLVRREPSLAPRLALVVCGAPAYMGGARYARRLERRAARLRVPVHFLGYVGDERKWSLFAAADLFLSTSAYEAYGLTIAQALASGTPVIATDHEGAQAILGSAMEASLPNAMGWSVPARAADLARALEHTVTRDFTPCRAVARAWGEEWPFRRAAARVWEVVGRVASDSQPRGSSK